MLFSLVSGTIPAMEVRALTNETQQTQTQNTESNEPDVKIGVLSDIHVSFDYMDETYHELCIWCQQEIKDGVSVLMKPVVRNWHANSLMSATAFMQFDSEETEHGKQD